jgi:hypothetical protein
MDTFNLTMLPPGEIVADVVAAQTAIPRSLSGKWRQIDFTAGGLVVARYARVVVQRPAQHLYVNELAALLNGGAGIIVPIQTGLTAPDGFVSAALSGAHALNAGTLSFSFSAGEALSGGEWLAINHAVKGWRAYRIWEIDVLGATYTVAIQPPLREATADLTAVDFANPRVVARLAEGSSLPWRLSGAWRGEFSVEFVERFEVG